MRAFPSLLLAALLIAAPAIAVEPDEVLADPALEQRAREISKDVRCLVCRNEAIDNSNAPLAKDLRILVRDRLKAGDTNLEVKDYLVDRYGEFVLLKPRFSLANAFLWASGPVLLILGGIAAVLYLRARRPEAERAEAPLSPEEQAEIDRLMRDGC